jgi:hypothetical protein
MVAVELLSAVALEYGWPAFERREIVPVAMERERLQEYAGTYSIEGTPIRVHVQIEGDRIDLVMPDGTRREMIPTSDDLFALTDGGATAKFERDAAGKVTTLLASGRAAHRVPEAP